MIDIGIKGRLKHFKEKQIPIRFSFFVLRNGLSLLVIITCFAPAHLPGYVSIIALLLIGALAGVWFLKPEWTNGILRLSIYMLIPYLLYFSQTAPAGLLTSVMVKRLYIVFSGVIVFFAVMTLKFTRRRRGFKATPMDFLILFIALVVPNLPDLGITGHHLGLMAAQIITILFSYEVLIGELRNEIKGLCVATVIALES